MTIKIDKPARIKPWYECEQQLMIEREPTGDIIISFMQPDEKERELLNEIGVLINAYKNRNYSRNGLRRFVREEK